ATRRRGSLAAQEARDLEVVRVVGRRPSGGRRVTRCALDPRYRCHGRLLVAGRRRAEHAVAALLALALELLEEVTLVGDAARRATFPPAGRLTLDPRLCLSAVHTSRAH